MNLNQTQTHHTDLARRAFLRRSAQLGVAGVAAPWTINLATMGEAAAFSATDYKALVCVFLYGANDHNNTVLPYDNANYGLYNTIRSGLQTPQANILQLSPNTALPGGMQLGLAPQMTQLQNLFNTGKAAVQLNVGPLVQPTTLAQYNAKSVPLPPKLFSHNDQQSNWMSSQSEGSVRGWGGRIGDLAMSNNTQSTFSCISVTGNAVFLAGQTAVPYQISANGPVAMSPLTSLYGSSSAGAALRTLITESRTQLLENEYNTVTARSINARTQVSAAFAGASPYTFTATNPLAMQLQAVARLIAANQSLGVKRQVFMVSIGGFDLHDFLVNQHPALLTNVSEALGQFYNATVAMGLSDKVTAFTASDFGRTLASNGDGSDHGWGSHHFVVGGAVAGKQFYGTAPAISLTTPDQVGQGRLLPSTGVDQYAATLASWFGVSATDMPMVVPNIANYSVKNMGFV